MRRMWMWVVAGLVSPPQLRVVVNIPAFRLEAFVDDSVVRTLPVAPGMPRYRTPRGEFTLTTIQWNPWWIPPDSPWARKEKPMPPGPMNPMGRVKLNFQPLYFIHASPAEQSIGSAASHGCIRMKTADAINLARLVHRYGTPSLTAEDVERFVIDTVTTRTIPLEARVPIEIRYDLVEVRGDIVSVYRDVYDLAMRSMRDLVFLELSMNGVDTLAVDPDRVRAFVRRVPQAGRSSVIDSLLRMPLPAARLARVPLAGSGNTVRKSLSGLPAFPDVLNTATVRNSNRRNSMSRGC